VRVSVDLARCEAHGECEMAAPQVFRLDDADKLQYDAAPDESLREMVEKAVRNCPAQAISLEG
jgi:ferredoxin